MPASKKPNKLIAEIEEILLELMQEGLGAFAENIIDQIMRKWDRATDSQKINAIKDVNDVGVNQYKNDIWYAMAVGTVEAYDAAIEEVKNKSKKLKLASKKESELSKQIRRDLKEIIKREDIKAAMETLPPSLQKEINQLASLTVGAQIEDIKKTIFFQFNSSNPSTDSSTILRDDLTEAALKYIDGISVKAGAGVSASKIVNSARIESFFDEDVYDVIEAFEFKNGDPVTPICTELAGQIFPKDDPNLLRYTPPLHWNCKSYIEPVLDLGNKVPEKLNPSKAARKSIQLDELENSGTLALTNNNLHKGCAHEGCN